MDGTIKSTLAKDVTLYARVWIEIFVSLSILSPLLVTLYARVWIEMYESARLVQNISVTLRVRVWIEMT